MIKRRGFSAWLGDWTDWTGLPWHASTPCPLSRFQNATSGSWMVLLARFACSSQAHAKSELPFAFLPSLSSLTHTHTHHPTCTQSPLTRLSATFRNHRQTTTMRAFAFLVALLSLAMAQAFLAPAALKAPRVVSDRERHKRRRRRRMRRMQRGVWWWVCGCAVARRAATGKRRVMQFFCSSHAGRSGATVQRWLHRVASVSTACPELPRLHACLLAARLLGPARHSRHAALSNLSCSF